MTKAKVQTTINTIEEVIVETPKTVAPKREMTADQMEALLGGNKTPEPVEEGKDTAGGDSTQKIVNASPAQLKYYHDLCGQKNEPIDESLIESKAVKAEIDRIKALPFFKPCSQAQIDRITELCTALKMPLPNFSKLNGAYGQSASNMIQKLKDMSKNVVLPISEKQMAMVMQMNFCPDVDPIDDVEGMSQKDASEHIAKYKDAFYSWKKDRLSPDQAKLIATLTERLGSPLPYAAIIQFNEGQAHEYIDQLQTELADKSLVETTLEPEDMYGIPDRDKEDARTELRSLVAKLYASIGQEIDEDTYETLSWTSLKSLIDFVKDFDIDVKAMFDRVTIFNADQIESLLA